MSRIEQQMLTKKIAAGELVYKEEDLVKEVCILIKGSVEADSKYGRTSITAGNVIGVLDLAGGKYIYSYKAAEECTVCYLSVDSLEDVINVMATNPAYPGMLVASLCRQIMTMAGQFENIKTLPNEIYRFIKDEYKNYKEVCAGYRKEPAVIKIIEAMEELDEDSIIITSDLDYYVNMDMIPLEIKKKFYASSEYITMTEISRVHEYVNEIITAYEVIIAYVNKVKNAIFAKNEDNLFMRLAELAFSINEANGDIALVWSRIKAISDFVFKYKCIEQAALPVLLGHFKTKIKVGAELGSDEEELTRQFTPEQIKGAKVLAKNAMDTIIEYSEIAKEQGDKFKQYLTVYNTLQDKFSTTDEINKLRKAITKQFYEIYEAVFFKAEETKVAEPVIDLFLNYGFVDERFITETQLVNLFYSKQEEYSGNYPIYSMREWLQLIYSGKAEPSKNEFDLDYIGVLRDKKRTHHVSEAEEKAYLADKKARVIFEINNMFKSANKVTSGRVLTFCPVLHKDTLVGDIDKLIVRKQAVADAFEEIQSVDFSLFHRTVLYHDDKNGITKEYIEKRVLPIVVLMPTFGSKGTMWQETSGARKDSPARFAMPILCKDDIKELLLSVAARYRWEICRNIQGVYWSDVTEKSLTSEYYDYMQFYKKNRDLSVQVKDKIRNALAKARNNYREVFVQDYIQWVKFEANGSSRLNKVVRQIMMTYCPFTKQIRSELAKFPTFADMIERFEIQRAAKLKKLENSYTSIRNSGGRMTKELEDNLEFYKM